MFYGGYTDELYLARKFELCFWVKCVNRDGDCVWLTLYLTISHQCSTWRTAVCGCVCALVCAGAFGLQFLFSDAGYIRLPVNIWLQKLHLGPSE